MIRLISIFFAAALALAAADVSGKWSGKWENGPDGGPGPHYMVLKQAAEKVTGTAGPNEDQQFPIANGKVVGDKLTFDIPLGGGAAVMKFDLKIDGDTVTGTANLEAGDQSRKDMKLTAKRVS